jgi:invasion protein IalB
MAKRARKIIGTASCLALVLITGGAAVSFADPNELPSWGAEVARSAGKATAITKTANEKKTSDKTASPSAKSAAELNAAAKEKTKPGTPAPTETGALPPAQAMKSETFADWVRECRSVQDKSVCTLRQTVRDAKKRRIVELIAARSPKTAFLEIKLPLGISIPHGVSLDLADNVKIPTQLVDCGATGCRSVVALDEKTMAQIKVAKGLSVSFQDSKSGKLITIGGSLKGFNDGIAKGIGAG